MPRSARLAAIDQMRGVAILLVLVYHLGPLDWRLAPYGASGWLAWPHLGAWWLAAPFLHFGFVGVHAFFVLSGFCIHLRAARAEKSTTGRAFSWRPFFLRRFWRIYPPYWIALGLFALVLPRIGTAIGARDLGLHALMLHTLDPRTFFSINPAFWSLATEEQFYLAYPLVLAARRRFGLGATLGAALGVSLAWRAAALVLLPPTVENFMAWRVLVHGLFLPRWFEWLLGCWLAERVAAGRPLAVKPALAIAVGLLTAGMLCRVHVAADKLLADGLFAGGFVALTGALLAGATSASRWRARAGALLAAVGRRAYGLYLVHQPIVDGRALLLPLRAALALAAGWLFSTVCERPFERRAHRVLEPTSTS